MGRFFSFGIDGRVRLTFREREIITRTSNEIDLFGAVYGNSDNKEKTGNLQGACDAQADGLDGRGPL